MRLGTVRDLDDLHQEAGLLVDPHVLIASQDLGLAPVSLPSGSAIVSLSRYPGGMRVRVLPCALLPGAGGQELVLPLDTRILH